MSELDSENFHSPTQLNPTPLLKDESPELKIYNLDPPQRESVTTADNDNEDEIVLSDLCRFRFMRNALIMTVIHLFSIVVLASLIKASEPSSFSMDLYSWDHIFGKDHYFSLTFVICLILTLFHSVARKNIINLGLFAIYTYAIANYIAFQGVWVAFTTASLGIIVCLCMPIQVLCILVYIIFKKKFDINYIELGMPCTISLLISSIIISFATPQLESFAKFFFIMTSMYIQLWYFHDLKGITTKNKNRMDIGDYIQAIMSFSFVIYKIQIILIVLNEYAEFLYGVTTVESRRNGEES